MTTQESSFKIERAAFIAGLKKFGINSKGFRFKMPSHYPSIPSYGKDTFELWRSEASRLNVEFGDWIPLVEDSGLIWSPLKDTEVPDIQKLTLTEFINSNIKNIGEPELEELDSQNWVCSNGLGDATDWVCYPFDLDKEEVLEGKSIWDFMGTVYVYDAYWGIIALEIDITREQAYEMFS